jgi:hypothetical protein
MKRKPLGKRLRFSIFARDNFTCRYCGRQSDSVELQVDHLIPVCKGGTNDESNLVTACVPCNQGKAGNLLDQAAPNETDRLRLAQELQEQRRAAQRAKKMVKAGAKRRDDFYKFLCELTGRDYFERSTFDTLFCYVKEYGEEIVYQWAAKAASKCWNDTSIGKYVSAIRRAEKEAKQ